MRDSFGEATPSGWFCGVFVPRSFDVFVPFSLVVIIFSFPITVRGGIVVRSWLRGRSAPGSKPYSDEDTPCMWACCTLNDTYGSKRSLVGVVWKFGVGGFSSGVVPVI
ncbi:hypothetical protein AVEN_201501-1 [Araneus ventricosus]|uniref:Uncharacterized protein n=1 Tax=Araneus ventricosus TaxID=182803 RepID=A0A4Y2SHD4_ARAVE|nr:hypothetical protein AVEN_201501-1 [Araneus ventricosus]